MDGDDPPPPKPLSIKLLENEVYAFQKSLKFKRPRGLRNLTWWGSERINLKTGYNINPNIVDEEFLDEIKLEKIGGITSKLVWIMRRRLGAGFYHNTLFRNSLIWKIFSSMLTKFLPYPYPDMSQAPVDKYPLQIYIDCDVLIVGGGLTGLTIAEELSKYIRNIVVLDGDQKGFGGYAAFLDSTNRNLKNLYNKLRKKGVKIVNGGVFQGFLEDGYIAYKYDTNQTIRIDSDVIIIATGSYEIPPLYENNDIPMTISLTTLLKLVMGYSITKLKKGILIGGMGDLIPALETLKKKGVDLFLVYRNKIPEKLRRFLEEKGIQYYENVYRISSKGRERVEYVTIVDEKGETLNIEVDFVAYSPIVAPDKEVVAQLGIKYVFDTRLGGYVPMHNLYGEIGPDLNFYIAGSAGGYIPIEYISDYAIITARYILNKIYGKGEGYESSASTLMNKIKETHPEIYEGLNSLDAAYRNNRSYEFVGWEKPPNIFHGDPTKIFVCFDMDILYSDLIHMYKDLGIWRMEHIKRYSGLGTGICQGRDCQLNASIIINNLSGKSFLDIGRFRARFPVIPQTLISLAGVET